MLYTDDSHLASDQVDQQSTNYSVPKNVTLGGRWIYGCMESCWKNLHLVS